VRIIERRAIDRGIHRRSIIRTDSDAIGEKTVSGYWVTERTGLDVDGHIGGEIRGRINTTAVYCALIEGRASDIECRRAAAAFDEQHARPAEVVVVEVETRHADRAGVVEEGDGSLVRRAGSVLHFGI